VKKREKKKEKEEQWMKENEKINKKMGVCSILCPLVRDWFALSIQRNV